jgi:hypothetical protein
VTPPKGQVTLDVYPAGVSSGQPISKRRISSAGGTFSAQLSVPGPGEYVVVARTKADATNAPGASAPLDVTVS